MNTDDQQLMSCLRAGNEQAMVQLLGVTCQRAVWRDSCSSFLWKIVTQTEKAETNAMYRSLRTSGVGGFTVAELLIAMMIFGIVTTMAVPKAAESIRIARIDRATRVVAIDLEQALGLAARQRSPVRIAQPGGTRQIVVTNVADGTVYSTTNLGDDTRVGVRVGELTLAPTSVNVFPTGLVFAALTVTLETGNHTRMVTMSQAGQIRVF